ncbi:glycosyltransferase family 2 protein [Syntrophaceticus schinkii]|uniref:glycosyltransferase family 2 protein n=1 Tax=Syntrophaceticus schinkii TaxID=499207 RepID=UPI001E2E8341|nr:glycosyltransferase [Syntrophaceticus schinkii]
MLSTVSVITPTYNHEKYIGQCIESVLEQTFTNWEMIIIDDGSTDNTQKIISKYRDARIKYIYQKNIGPYRLGETYNKALSLSKGDLIAILEGDDIWPPDKLEKQISVFDDPEIVLSHGNYELVYLKNGVLNFKPGYVRQINNILNNEPVGTSLYGLVDGIVPVAVTIMIRKSALIKIGGFKYADYLPCVDLPTELELSLMGKFKYIPTLLGYFRRHKNSITHNLRKDNNNFNRFKYVNKFVKLNKKKNNAIRNILGQNRKTDEGKY